MPRCLDVSLVIVFQCSQHMPACPRILLQMSAQAIQGVKRGVSLENAPSFAGPDAAASFLMSKPVKFGFDMVMSIVT